MEDIGQFYEVESSDKDILIEVHQYVNEYDRCVFLGDKHGNLGIQFSSDNIFNKLLVSNIDIKGLIHFLHEMQRRLEEQKIINKLAGV